MFNIIRENRISSAIWKLPLSKTLLESPYEWKLASHLIVDVWFKRMHRRALKVAWWFVMNHCLSSYMWYQNLLGEIIKQPSLDVDPSGSTKGPFIFVRNTYLCPFSFIRVIIPPLFYCLPVISVGYWKISRTDENYAYVKNVCILSVCPLKFWPMS